MKETIKKYYSGWLEGKEPYCSKVDKFLAAVIYIVSGIALILVLSGSDIHFVTVDSIQKINRRYTIIYESDTKVMYLLVENYSGIFITPLYNADGTLKVYGE